MDQVDFYILENKDANGKLHYACRLVQKAYARGLKIGVHTQNNEQTENFDSMLWTFSQGSFIPHQAVKSNSPDWWAYPVQIGSEPEAFAQADIVVNLSTSADAYEGECKRVAELLSNEEDDKSAGRNRFKQYQDKGLVPNTYRIN